jgi:hypothetical protein
MRACSQESWSIVTASYPRTRQLIEGSSEHSRKSSERRTEQEKAAGFRRVSRHCESCDKPWVPKASPIITPSANKPLLQYPWNQATVSAYPLGKLKGTPDVSIPESCIPPGAAMALRELSLEGWAAQRRRDLLQLLKALNEHIRQLDEAAERAAKQDSKAVLLMTQPGVGPITASAFVLMIGDVGRFRRGLLMPE